MLEVENGRVCRMSKGFGEKYIRAYVQRLNLHSRPCVLCDGGRLHTVFRSLSFGIGILARCTKCSWSWSFFPGGDVEKDWERIMKMLSDVVAQRVMDEIVAPEKNEGWD